MKIANDYWNILKAEKDLFTISYFITKVLLLLGDIIGFSSF